MHGCFGWPVIAPLQCGRAGAAALILVGCMVHAPYARRDVFLAAQTACPGSSKGSGNGKCGLESLLLAAALLSRRAPLLPFPASREYAWQPQQQHAANSSACRAPQTLLPHCCSAPPQRLLEKPQRTEIAVPQLRPPPVWRAQQPPLPPPAATKPAGPMPLPRGPPAGCKVTLAVVGDVHSQWDADE